MPALPTSASFTGGSVTEGQFKAALTALRDYLSGLLGADGAVATALATLGAPFSSHAEKTATYTVNLGDRGRLITASGAGGWTLSLPAAATAGAGFVFCLRNASTGNITIDPSGAELVNGLSTLVVGPGGDAMILCTNADWVVVGSTGNEAVSLPLGTVDTPALRFLTRPGVGLFSPAANVLGFAINATERMRLTTTGAQITGLLTGTAVTQSANDSTTGRLLKVFDFGIGNPPNTTAISSSGPLSTFPSGLSRISGGSSEQPAGVGTGTVFTACNQSGRMAQQVHATQFNRLYTRSSHDDVWSAWSMIYGQNNVLGTVSQSSGVPTGAIIERGSNANGEYVRFADGTQICTRTLTASSSAGVAWTFPAAFVAAPVVNGNAVATVLSAVCLDAAPTATAATLSVRDKADARRADVMHLVATGRWF